MKGKRFTEEQIIGVLRESEAGAETKDLCRRHGISEQSFYRWKAKYGGMDVSDAKKLRGRASATEGSPSSSRTTGRSSRAGRC